jgi:hypothetical protein
MVKRYTRPDCALCFVAANNLEVDSPFEGIKKHYDLIIDLNKWFLTDDKKSNRTSKTGILKILKKLDEMQEAKIEITEKEIILTDKSNKDNKFTIPLKDRYGQAMRIKPFPVADSPVANSIKFKPFYKMDLTKEFIEEVLKLKKIARTFNNRICFMVANGKLKVKFYDKLNPKSKTPELILADSIEFKDLDFRNTFSQSKNLAIEFNYMDLKNFAELTNDYTGFELRFGYNIDSDCGHIEAVDKKGNYTCTFVGEELYDIKYDSEEWLFEKPELPAKWDWAESIKKMRNKIYKWKNLTEETIKELYIAKQILKMSKSDAAKIMHRKKLRCMGWTRYCHEIGSSPQVVNGWLRRYGLEGPEEKDKDVNEWKLPSKYTKSIKKIIDVNFDPSFCKIYRNNGRVFSNAQACGPSLEFDMIGLFREIKSNKVSEALVLTNTSYTAKRWFKNLFNGIMCFTNHQIQFNSNGKNSQGSCFVYFGKDEDKFIEEFSKYGTLVKKVGKVEWRVSDDDFDISDEELLKELENY